MRKSWLGQLVSGVVLLSGMAMTAPADAETITVCIDGTCDFTDIQSAISIAANGDILEVGPGNYSLPASFASSIPVVRPGGKAIRIRGSNNTLGEPVTVIDGKGQRAAAICNNAEGPNTIFENLAFTGSANSIGYCVSISGCEPKFVNCVIRDNPRMGLYVFGTSLRKPNFDRCRFTNSLDGPGVVINNASPVFQDCLISGNVARQGAGVYIYDSFTTGIPAPKFLNCTISNNRAVPDSSGYGGDGGGLYLSNTEATFSDCFVTDNFADDVGATAGGVLITYHDASVLLRCTIARNHAAYGGGVYMSGDELADESRLVDCMITENSAQEGGGIFVSADKELVLERCQIRSNSATSVAGGLYFEEPVVVTALESLICGNTSPIGSQIWGNGWPTGGNNCVNNSCSVCDPACVGDLNNDDLVDGADLGALLVAWGTNGSSQPGSDVNDDGVVDGADLGALLVAWGGCT